MKTIINSSDIGMLRHWTNLVQVEDGDKAVRMVDGCQDWFQHHPAGTYLIETQVNQQAAIRAYHKISAEKAEKFLAMPVREAVKAMDEEVYA